MLKISQNLLNEHSKKLLYYTQIQSHINYGLGLWGPISPRSKLNKILKTQNNCAKLINKSKTLQELGLLDIDRLIQQELCKFGKRFADNDLPSPILLSMSTGSSRKSLEKMHRYQTRHKNLPNTPKIVGNKYQHCYLVRSIAEYQKLPKHIRDAKTMLRFKKELKKHILN